jgi:hypothetical protein
MLIAKRLVTKRVRIKAASYCMFRLCCACFLPRVDWRPICRIYRDRSTSRRSRQVVEFLRELGEREGLLPRPSALHRARQQQHLCQTQLPSLPSNMPTARSPGRTARGQGQRVTVGITPRFHLNLLLSLSVLSVLLIQSISLQLYPFSSTAS